MKTSPHRFICLLTLLAFLIGGSLTLRKQRRLSLPSKTTQNHSILEERTIREKPTAVVAQTKASTTTSTFEDRWPHATVLASQELPLDGGPLIKRVSLIDSGDDLPFLIRSEETLRPAKQGLADEILVNRLEMVANHFLLEHDPALPLENIATAVDAIGGQLVPHASSEDLYYVKLPESAVRENLDLVPQTIAALDPQVAAARFMEPDYIVHASEVRPNDPLFPQLWGLDNPSSTSAGDPDIDAPEAWEIRREAPSVVVAVIDSGMRVTHQDLAPNLWHNPNEIPNNGIDDDRNGIVDDVHGLNAINNTGNPTDENGHGTHVAGTIGAAGNNGVGVSGVAWDVQLMGLKFLGGSGGGATSAAIRCIDYARTQGAMVVNNSWGGGGASRSLQSAIERTQAAGMLFVVAAGNDSADNEIRASYPANYPVDNVISVASITRSNTLSTFSNTGESNVHLAAPGSDIVSTWHTSDSAYNRISGTSMAAPHVSGVLAVLMAEFPNENAEDIKHRLLAGVEPMGSSHSSSGLAGRVVTGGRVNLYKALTLSNPSTLPEISQGLSDQSVVSGQLATLRVNVSDGGLETTFTWSRNGIILEGETQAFLNLASATVDDAGRYRVAASNASGTVTSTAQIEVRVPDSLLASSVGAPDTPFFSDGNARWQPLDSGSNGGLRSGPLGAQGRSWLRTSMEGPGQFEFEWSVSSEKDFDFLYFLVDGNIVDRLSGEEPWTTVQLDLAEGSHEIAWVYAKDQFVESGEDAGFVRNVGSTSEGQGFTDFDGWVRSSFDDVEFTDESLISPDADPDRDGLSNLLEYAFGLNPKENSTEGLPELFQLDRRDGLNTLQIVYRERTDTQENALQYIVEQSTDLVSWQPMANASAIQESATPLNESLQQVTREFAFPNDGPRFLRVVVNHGQSQI